VTTNSSFKNTSSQAQKTSNITVDPQYLAIGIEKNSFHLGQRPHAWFQLKPPYNSPLHTDHLSKQVMDL